MRHLIEADWDVLRGLHAEIVCELDGRLDGAHSAVIDTLATIAVADACAAAWLFGEDVGDPCAFASDAAALVERVYSAQPVTVKYAEKGRHWFVGFVASRKAHFERSDGKGVHVGTDPVLGRIKGDEVAVFPSRFREEAKRDGLDAERLLRDFAGPGWLKVTEQKDGDGTRTRQTCRRKIGGRKCQVYAFSMSKMEAE